MIGETIRFVLCAAFMLSGLVIMLGAAIGNFRFRTALNRMHAAAMGDSLGKLCLLIGLMLYQWGGTVEVKLLFILAFFWMAGPVCSHMLCEFEVTTNALMKKEEEVKKDVDSV